ncbi:MAG: hypothetical protein SAK29_27760 [Scytonema sp. PMC 1069.18]|nr:hypothetical protein [Scytonema sp. PMC 1069.18]MEC4883264.1 hypothetical protein [Scytonema sp. PMC 1070.18]
MVIEVLRNLRNNERVFCDLNQIQEVKRQIAQLKLQLSQSSQIISKFDGRVLEVGVLPGGDRLLCYVLKTI